MARNGAGRVSCWWVSAAVVVVLTGCGGIPKGAGGPDGDVPPQEFGSYENYLAEYRSTKESLSFPAGYPPDRQRHDPPPTDDSVWERGAGAADATLEWHCAWGAELLNAPTSERRAKALNMFKSVVDMPTWEQGWAPETKQKVRERIAAAEVGDYSPVAESVAANCNDLLKPKA